MTVEEEFQTAAATLLKAASGTEVLDEWAEFYGTDTDLPEADRPWLALMSPALAKPLAEALKQHGTDHGIHDCTWVNCGLLAVAREINREVTS